MYEIKFASGIKKDIKKIPKELIKEIKYNHLEAIKGTPLEYARLKGKYNKFRKYKMFHKNNEYRIIYYVEGHIVKILVIDSREGVYKKLKNRFKQYLK